MKNSIEIVSKMIDFAIENPEASPDRVLVINMKKDTFEKLLTPSRMEIIRTIKRTNPQTVGELARKIKRPMESVSRDLRILESYGILELIKTGKTKSPKIKKEMILIPLTY